MNGRRLLGRPFVGPGKRFFPDRVWLKPELVDEHRTKQNLRRLAAAREIKPTLRNAPKDLPFIIDEQTLALGSNFTFDTRFGDLDLLLS